MIDIAKHDDTPEMAYALVIAPNFRRDGTCFSARRSGLYRSTDGGRTWQSAYDALGLSEPLPTTAVAMSPFFGFGSDRTVFAGVNGAVLRSYDSGETWHTAALPNPPPLVSTLAVSPNFDQDNTVLAGTLEDGIFCSTDGGAHWTPWNFGLLDLNVLALAISPDFVRDETVYAGTSTGIFRSTNGGRAWREVGFPDNFAPVLSLAISREYAQDQTLYAGTEAHGLYVSKEQGQSWTRMTHPVLPDEVAHIVIYYSLTMPMFVTYLPNTAILIRDGNELYVNAIRESPS